MAQILYSSLHVLASNPSCVRESLYNLVGFTVKELLTEKKEKALREPWLVFFLFVCLFIAPVSPLIINHVGEGNKGGKN